MVPGVSACLLFVVMPGRRQ
uniref:Uncharacterized protein n=1 Tax=Arundo donax TaxID=35708 RepID=A0A0A8YFH5_ARUDO